MFVKFDFMIDSKFYFLLIGFCGMIGEFFDIFFFKGYSYYYGIYYMKEIIVVFEEFV